MASVKKSKAETRRNYVALLRIYGLDKISPREQSRLRARTYCQLCGSDLTIMRSHDCPTPIAHLIPKSPMKPTKEKFVVIQKERTGIYVLGKQRKAKERTYCQLCGSDLTIMRSHDCPTPIAHLIPKSPMKPTKEIIDKAAHRGALLQDVQVIMWEFTKKRESDESVDWIEYAQKIIDVVEGKKGV